MCALNTSAACPGLSRTALTRLLTPGVACLRWHSCRYRLRCSSVIWLANSDLSVSSLRDQEVNTEFSELSLLLGAGGRGAVGRGVGGRGEGGRVMGNVPSAPVQDRNNCKNQSHSQLRMRRPTPLVLFLPTSQRTLQFPHAIAPAGSFWNYTGVTNIQQSGAGKLRRFDSRHCIISILKFFRCFPNWNTISIYGTKRLLNTSTDQWNHRIRPPDVCIAYC